MREQVKFWRKPQFGNLELLHARYITHAFSRHTHDTYAIAVIEQGAEEFAYRGETYITPAGDIAIINPGEVHTGHAADETGWTYRVLYPDPSILVQAACEASGRKQEIPFFPTPVIQDKQLAQLLWRLHTALEGLTSKLEQDSRLLWTLAQLITRHADSRPNLKSVGNESHSVKRVRDYLEANYTENVTLEQLSAIANLSPFYLLRTFHKQVGLPPHGYLNQVRLVRAKCLLSQGWQISQVAQQTGFADQSHLTRQFKRMVGVTPGQYQYREQ
jgi:AraC-like DNA-binding protein